MRPEQPEMGVGHATAFQERLREQLVDAAERRQDQGRSMRQYADRLGRRNERNRSMPADETYYPLGRPTTAAEDEAATAAFASGWGAVDVDVDGESLGAGPGADLITQERLRQMNEEGYTPDHDDDHGTDLVPAAIAYALSSTPPEDPEDAFGHKDPALWWPWDIHGFKPNGAAVDGGVRDLVKAGALIAAEIDRRLRLPEWDDSEDADGEASALAGH